MFWMSCGAVYLTHVFKDTRSDQHHSAWPLPRPHYLPEMRYIQYTRSANRFDSTGLDN